MAKFNSRSPLSNPFTVSVTTHALVYMMMCWYVTWSCCGYSSFHSGVTELSNLSEGDSVPSSSRRPRFPSHTPSSSSCFRFLARGSAAGLAFYNRCILLQNIVQQNIGVKGSYNSLWRYGLNYFITLTEIYNIVKLIRFYLNLNFNLKKMTLRSEQWFCWKITFYLWLFCYCYLRLHGVPIRAAYRGQGRDTIRIAIYALRLRF